jgi:3',5'-cyclic-AMP phosphodiesterase
MSVSHRYRPAVLLFLFFFFCGIWPLQAAAAPSTLFDRSLQKLETKIKNGAAAGEFNFVVMGDSRDNDEVFTRILTLAASYKPLFILHDGDIVSRGTREEYDHFLETLQKTVPDVPFFVVVGNHELKKKDKGLFKAKIAPLDYVLEPAGTGMKIVALNTAGYSLTPVQLQSLDQELSREGKLSFVIMHVPPRTGRWNTDHFFSRGAGELSRILAGRKIPMAFFGHEHLYDEDLIDGVRYIITGGAGAPLYNAGFGDPSYHFIVVKVKDNSASAEVVRLRR